MLVAFSVAPAGPLADDASMAPVVAAAVRVVRDSGLPYRLDSMFTSVEGEWEEVMDVVRRATEAVLEHAPRASLVLKADVRPGHAGMLSRKAAAVEEVLARDAG